MAAAAVGDGEGVGGAGGRRQVEIGRNVHKRDQKKKGVPVFFVFCCLFFFVLFSIVQPTQQQKLL